MFTGEIKVIGNNFTSTVLGTQYLFECFYLYLLQQLKHFYWLMCRALFPFVITEYDFLYFIPDLHQRKYEFL